MLSLKEPSFLLSLKELTDEGVGTNSSFSAMFTVHGSSSEEGSSTVLARSFASPSAVLARSFASSLCINTFFMLELVNSEVSEDSCVKPTSDRLLTVSS